MITRQSCEANLFDWVENPIGSWFIITSLWNFVGIEDETE